MHRMCAVNKCTEIFYFAITVWVLKQSTKESFIQSSRSKIADHYFYFYRCSAGNHYIFCLRKNIRIHKKLWSCNLISLVFIIKKHRHSFRGGSAFIQQRCIGNWQPGKVTNHGLIIQ